MDYHIENERIPSCSLSRVYHYALKLGISCTAQMSLGWLWQVQVPSNISSLPFTEIEDVLEKYVSDPSRCCIQLDILLMYLSSSTPVFLFLSPSLYYWYLFR